MDAWNFLDDEAKAKQAKKLTPAERAALFYFADYQSPAEIADQRVPVKKVAPTDRIERREWGLQRDARNAYCQQLIAACDAGEITHTKTEKKTELFIPGGGERVPPTRNSYLLWDGPSTEWQSRDFNDFQNRVPKVTNYNYSIHKDDFKNYLKSIRDWPVTGLLANWWADDTVSQAPNKNKSAGGLIFTPPEHRKNREELDELRHLQKEQQRERDKKRREDELKDFHKRMQFIADQPKRYKEMLIEVQMEASRRLEAENQAKAAQPQAEVVSNAGTGGEVVTHNQKSRNSTSVNTVASRNANTNQSQDKEPGRPEERQAYFSQIWEDLEKPKRNEKILFELKKRSEQADKDACPISKMVWNVEFSFQYEDGSIDPIVLKTFQNDMCAIRKQNK